MKTISITVLTLVLAAILIPAGAWAYMHSGRYDVAANRPEEPTIAALLSMTSDASVAWHARSIPAPALTDPSMIHKGFMIYRDDCVECHGAPGAYPTEISRGMQPVPPRLWKSTADMSPSAVFGGIKNGIKMTGMPSWQKEDNDRDIWNLVAFVKDQFPKLSPRQYAQMDRQAGVQDHEAGDADERGAGVEHDDADEHHAKAEHGDADEHHAKAEHGDADEHGAEKRDSD